MAMTPTDLIDRVLAADEAATSKYGPQKKYPFYFVEHPEVNEFIDAASRLARSLRIAEEALRLILMRGDDPSDPNEVIAKCFAFAKEAQEAIEKELGNAE